MYSHAQLTGICLEIGIGESSMGEFVYAPQTIMYRSQPNSTLFVQLKSDSTRIYETSMDEFHMLVENKIDSIRLWSAKTSSSGKPAYIQSLGCWENLQKMIFCNNDFFLTILYKNVFLALKRTFCFLYCILFHFYHLKDENVI